MPVQRSLGQEFPSAHLFRTGEVSKCLKQKEKDNSKENNNSLPKTAFKEFFHFQVNVLLVSVSRCFMADLPIFYFRSRNSKAQQFQNHHHAGSGRPCCRWVQIAVEPLSFLSHRYHTQEILWG